MTPTELELARHLRRASLAGAMTSELADKIGRSEATVRAHLSRMREKGYVEVAHAHRCGFWTLTTEGRRNR